MSISRQSRRKFLKVTSALAVGGVLAGTARGAAGQPLIRKDLATLDVNSPEIQSYAKAYQAMKNLDPSDPHSWSYQANMHGINPPDNLGPDGVWNTCQHGNWWFFPWHRMYLYYFERIIRKYSADPNFALPYWHWDNTDGSQLVLHKAFLPGGPLFIPQRSDAANGGQPIDSIDNILDDPRNGKNAAVAEQRFFVSSFEPGFGGPFLNQPIHFNQVHGLLEGDGHDIIHGDTGGDTGWMSDPLQAAGDPIFWVHHANVDRIWIEWLKMGGQRSNPSPTDSAGEIWYQPKFSFFDENKMKVTLGPADVLDTINQLGYAYDMYPDYHPVAAVAVAALDEDAKKPPKPVAESSARGQKVGAAPLRITFQIPEAAKAGLEAVSKGGRGPAQLTIHGVKIKGNRGSNFRVYLNLAEGEAPPSIKDPRYAGTFTFFRHEHDDMGVTSTIPLTQAVRDLRKAGLWKDGELSVTLVQRRASERKESVPEIPFEKLTVDLPQP